MKTIHKKRLAKLALALLDHWDARRKVLVTGKQELKFAMDFYLQKKTEDYCEIIDEPSNHRCGTSCCFAGFAPAVFPAVRKMTDWDDVTEYVAGVPAEDANRTWSFLFASSWPNDPVQAVKRALHIISDKPVPAELLYEWDRTRAYYPSMSKAKLRAALLPYAEKGRAK